MLEEMNQKLDELFQGMNRCKKLETMLESLRKQLAEAQEKESELITALKKEELDVEKFHKMSLTAIFYTILGSKEERLDKEQREALAAKLKLEEATRQIEYLENQIKNLTEEKRQVSGCREQYNRLFEEKYQLLKQSGNENSEKIAELEKEAAAIQVSLKEINEAVTAGNRVIDRIKSVQDSLDSAHGWGTWDMFGGGGLITDMVKHSHIDDAKEAASEVQNLLSCFRTELADIKIESQIDIQIEGFSKFADFFFDGLIADWVVQSKINESLESVQKVKEEVLQVLNRLDSMKYSAEDSMNHLRTELEQFVKSV